MDFAHPERLWILAALPPLAAWVAWGLRRRGRSWRALGQPGRPARGGAWGWVAAASAVVLALAQPRWGRAPGEGLPAGHDVVLLVDVSRSMGAEDAEPSRLGAAQRLAGGLLEALGREPGHRAAVVAFAGRGATACPLTEALGAAGEALAALKPGGVRPGGTDLGAGLAEALEAFDEQEAAGGRTIVLFSDGEDHGSTWEEVLPRLRDARVLVHVVALGDPDRGQPVPSGGPQPLTFEGRPVSSRRQDAALEAIARATGGATLPFGIARGDLGSLYLERIAPVARLRQAALLPSGRPERFPLLLALAALAASWATWAEGSRGRPGRRRSAVALLGLLAAGAAGADGAAEAIERGRRAYGEGAFPRARAAFGEAIALDPSAAVPYFDAAAAHFRGGEFAEAEGLYRQARDRAEGVLRIKVDFALGNTALARGDLPAALRHYDDCLASRGGGASAERTRSDARENRRFAAALAAMGTEGSEEPKPDLSKSPDEGPGGREPGAPTPGGSGADGGAESRSTDRQGAGGAGGNSPAPPKPGSPAARLAEATDRIRAEHRRREDEASPEGPAAGGKDW